jgi:uncharacterized protein YxjI
MLDRTQYFVREHVDFMKLSGKYDILDPQTKAKIGEAVEEISGWIKFFRLLIDKKLMPTKFVVYETPDSQTRRRLFSIKRPVAFLRPKVQVYDATGAPLGFFQAKVFTIGGAFRVFTTDGTEIAVVKGDWKGWNFRFLSGDTELGVVTKQWAGLGKELFTTADNYMISIHGAKDPTMSTLLLAAGLAVDTIYKEKN